MHLISYGTGDIFIAIFTIAKFFHDFSPINNSSYILLRKKLEKGFTYKKIQYNFIFFFFHNTIDRHIDWKGGTIMFKKYVKQFLTDESGMELLQLAIVVVITVGLIGVMTKLMNTVRENISKANDNANTEMQGILRDANSDS